jgi:hypothetical protein
MSREFGNSLRHDVFVALAGAGFAPGSRASGGGRKMTRGEYRPPEAGFVVEDHRHLMAIRRSTGLPFAPGEDDDLDFTERDWSSVRELFVEHAGTGAKDALPRYLAALRAAGIEAEIGPRRKHLPSILAGKNPKMVVWISRLAAWDGKAMDEARSAAFTAALTMNRAGAYLGHEQGTAGAAEGVARGP